MLCPRKKKKYIAWEVRGNATLVYVFEWDGESSAKRVKQNPQVGKSKPPPGVPLNGTTPTHGRETI